MDRHWLAVASAEHVRRGRKGGFMQVCHGRPAPLRRIRAGDGIVCYSPSTQSRGKDALHAFTAIGTVGGGAYQVDMGGGFRPFRRDVDWADALEAPIRPLLDRLELSAGKPGWGYQLRFGLLPLSGGDFGLIAAAMGARFVAILATMSKPAGPTSSSGICQHPGRYR